MSREECDKLIKIIKSRVVGCTTIEDAENTRSSEMPNKIAGNRSAYSYRTTKLQFITILTYGGDYIADIDTPDLSATAVSEAKKWLMEKRLGSASKSDLDYGTMNSVLFPQVSSLSSDIIAWLSSCLPLSMFDTVILNLRDKIFHMP